MPSTLETIGAFIQVAALESHAAVRTDSLCIHIPDLLGMILQGASLADGKTAISVGSPLVGWCASARLTEADDIHLTSCTTPGSVVVPTAFHLAAAGVLETWGDLLT